METLKYRSRMTTGGKNMAGGGGNSHDSDMESLMLSSCWGQQSNSNDYLMDSQKMILDNTISSLGSLDPNINQDDSLDSLLMNSNSVNNNNLAELKPLPPFAGYTANLSINGIQGHHYHAIAQRIMSPEENNNNYNNSYSNEHNIVSSSTCSISADPNPDSSVKTLYDSNQLVDECVDSVSGVKLEYSDCMSTADSCVVDSAQQVDSQQSIIVKNELNEYVDISSIEDIAAIIGSAIADTTVPNNNQVMIDDDPNASRDSWMDLDAWIDGACVDNSSHKIISQTDSGISEFILPNSPQDSPLNNEYCKSNLDFNNSKVLQNQGNSTLQNLLTHGYMPLLQNRLQNGPPQQSVKQEAPSSTSYGVDLISTSSPPANVVSTTDNILLNGRYISQQQYLNNCIQDDRIRSPDLLQNYPHTTTSTNPNKKQRNRTPKKHQMHSHHMNHIPHSATSTSAVYASEQSLGLLGKEKPVHRCHICNRGFLNKSNIKVHLRTHTGEKPFRCETCAKAFRQKAHLIKHQQIHKRIGRD